MSSDIETFFKQYGIETATYEDPEQLQQLMEKWCEGIMHAYRHLLNKENPDVIRSKPEPDVLQLRDKQPDIATALLFVVRMNSYRLIRKYLESKTGTSNLQQYYRSRFREFASDLQGDGSRYFDENLKQTWFPNALATLRSMLGMLLRDPDAFTVDEETIRNMIPKNIYTSGPCTLHEQRTALKNEYGMDGDMLKGYY